MFQPAAQVAGSRSVVDRTAALLARVDVSLLCCFVWKFGVLLYLIVIVHCHLLSSSSHVLMNRS